MTPLHEASIGIIFGTDTGNTEDMAEKMSDELQAMGCSAAQLVNVVDVTPEWFAALDFIIMGIPTWDFGGIQEDWENYEDVIQLLPLSDKVVALYGMGDQLGYGDYFVDALGWLHERIVPTGARIIGRWSTEGYDFEASLACNADKTEFCGLAIDDDQQFDLTDERIQQWIAQLQTEYGQLVAAA